jgi:hypothetical protein
MNQADVDRIFDYHDPDPESREKHESIRAAFKKLAITCSNLPAGRERALVMTKLEEASFFAHAAIARPPA